MMNAEIDTDGNGAFADLANQQQRPQDTENMVGILMAQALRDEHIIEAIGKAIDDDDKERVFALAKELINR